MVRHRRKTIIFLLIAATLFALKAIPDLYSAVREASGHPVPPQIFFAGVIAGALIMEWAILAAVWTKLRPRRRFLIPCALLGAVGSLLIITAGQRPGTQAEFRFAVDLALIAMPLIQIAMLPRADHANTLI